MSASDWAARLAAELPSVSVAVDGEDLKVDLWWIAAADDSTLAAMLDGVRETTGQGSASPLPGSSRDPTGSGRSESGL